VKHSIVVLLLFALLETNLHAATIQFNWTGTNGTARANNNTPLASGFTILTFMSPDTTFTWSSSWSDSTDGGAYGASGNDIFFDARGSSLAGRPATAAIIESSSSHVGYYIYGVIIDADYASLFSISGASDGMYYDITVPTYWGPLQDTELAGLPTVCNVNTDPLRTTSQLTVVPEPTTLALLATGMGVVLMRRRKKQTVETEQSI
jgi:hypothetical protein